MNIRPVLFFLIFMYISASYALTPLVLSPSADLSLKKGQTAETKFIAVNSNIKYDLVFSGKLNGKEALEDNPRFQMTLRHRWRDKDKKYDFLPNIKFKFYDHNKEYVITKNYCALPFKNWYKYCFTFYPPQRSAFMKVVISSGSNTELFELKEISFKTSIQKDSINVNPNVNKSGLYNYCAWDRFSPGAIIIRKADGKTAFDACYGSFSVSFPLKPRGRYSCTAKALPNAYAPSLKLLTYDKNSKEINRIKLDTKTEFSTPANCVRGVIFVRSLLVDEIVLNESK